jgi:hypothetical protein
MTRQAGASRKLLVMLGAVVALAVSAQSSYAQRAGVVIDPKGTLQTQYFADPDGSLTRQQIQAAKAALPHQVAAYSACRKVSLTRLEEALRKAGGAPNDEMRYLAGLLRVHYVFFYPDSKDIVVAGPAEGWFQDVAGRVVGLTSGRPVVQLQDLVVALRAFPPGGSSTGVIGCSIDPTQEGLAALQQYLRNVGRTVNPAMTNELTAGLKSSLGLQNVTVDGVAANTHFAQVLVEADYRMKLIGIGLERPPVKMTAFIDRASPSQVSRNALFRWYFVPDYQCVRVSDDHQAMELVGDGVKLVGEDELVSGQGQRQAAGRGNAASQVFVKSFTEKYPALAEKSPVYAELRNLVDLSIAAAFIQDQGYYAKAGWKMELFGSEKSFSVETYPAPKRVDSAVAAVWKGSQLMTPIGGGVQIHAATALESKNLLPDEKGKVDAMRKSLTIDLPEGRWWWD